MRNRNMIKAAALVCAMTFTSLAYALEMRMAHASSPDGAIGQATDFFARLVGEKTEGRWTIKTFHNGQLGGERESAESCQLGNLDLAVVNQGPLGNFVPEISVVDLPYIINSYEHAFEVFGGEIGQDFIDRLGNVGLKGLSIWESGFRNLTNSKVDVKTVDDVRGLRVRVMENQIHQDLWRALGADPVPMAWGDAYTALQQGAIDGQENPIVIIDTNNVVEVNKKLAMTEHCFATVFIVMSPMRWASIPPADQKIVQECADEARDYLRELTRKMDEESLKKLQSRGMVVTYPDKAGFIEKSQSVREKYGKRFAAVLAKIEALK